MRMPERPPQLPLILDDKAIKKVVEDKEVFDLVKRYNEEYLHWDELRYHDIPVNPEIVWAFMKLMRINQAKHLEVSDIKLVYNITNQAQRIIHLLDTGASELLVLEEPKHGSRMERYAVSSLMEEAIASSQLEGAVTTTKVAKRMLREGRKPRSPSEHMILNDYQTMQRIKEIKDLPLSTTTILELHRSIAHGLLEDESSAGRFRTDDETVVADGFEIEKVYHRPPSYQKIPEYMGGLCAFVNADAKDDFQHPLVKAVIIHFLIGYLHPFIDGNGRLARALMYWYALKRDYWLFEYMAISKVIKQSRGGYAMAYLFAETDDNDVTYFLNYNLNCMEKALTNLKSCILRRQSEQREVMMLVEAHPQLNQRQAEILKDMVRRKGEATSISEIMSKYNVVHQTARTDLLLLSELGFLEKKKVGKRLYFKVLVRD